MTIHRSTKRASADPRAPKNRGGTEVEAAALCGHSVRFFVLPDDPYDAQRRAKFTGRKCKVCREADNKVRMLAESATKRGDKIKDGQEVKYLPVDTRILLTREASGRWSGMLYAAGYHLESDAAGLMSVIKKLAVAYVKAAKLTAKDAVATGTTDTNGLNRT